jgi:hypothetical protein
MRTFFGLILLVLAVLMLTSELMYLADPTMGLPLSNAADVFIASPPWYVHAGRWMLIVAATLASSWLLNGGILGRLVRGRGLTPEPVRR